MRGLVFFCTVVCCLPSSAVRADVKDNLQKRGVRISTSGATLTAETDIAGDLKEVATLRRALIQATKQHDDHQKSIDELKQQITRINQQLVGLNSQLANVQDVVQNNRLVGAIKALEGQLRLADDGLEQKKQRETTLQGQVSTARDSIISHVLRMRKAVDEITAQYRAIDKDTQKLIDQFNTETGSTVKLQPSSVFTANVRKLEQLESGIQSEAISLRRDGNTYFARVQINGEHVVEMVVDSGASTVVLPFEEAVKAGMKPVGETPQVRMTVADGRTITGRLMKIDSLKLGQFVVKDVECVVLNANVRKAPPLLGMSLLGKFRFELNSSKSTLSLVELREQVAGIAREEPHPAKEPFELKRDDWKLIPAVPAVQYWSNRDFKLVMLPKELEKTLVLVRENEQQDWLSGEVVANRRTRVYVALLKRISRKEQGGKDTRIFYANTTQNLKDKGWEEVEGFHAEGKEDEEWLWGLFAKEFDPGPIKVSPPPITIRTRMVFFMGVADEKRESVP
jgi:clan AA aspartic protease (TIGR02281 family)